MKIEPFRSDDIAPFLKLAAEEGWVAEKWEFDFLLSAFSQGSFAARGDDGETAGFVTSLRHERSGWIGNLIVSAGYRGRGIGESLFRKALDTLLDSGVETVWLTASQAGKTLYEKHGFKSIDTIIRWVGRGRQRQAVHSESTERDGLMDSSHEIDARSWSDSRSALLEATVRRGNLLQDGSGFIVLQSCGKGIQFGPFSALDDITAGRLFEKASKSIALGTRVVVDAPASNRAALRLFNHRKMKIAGSNLLMYAGIKPDYRPELIYGLATMGSCG